MIIRSTRGKAGLFATALLLPLATLDATSAGACDGIVGDWAWFIGGKVTFSLGARVRWTPAISGMPPAVGAWTCAPGSGVYTVTWQNGFVDTLSLSPDGSKLTGISSTGVAVSGWRARAASGGAPAGNAPTANTATTAPAAPSTQTPTSRPSTSSAIDHNPSVREILQDRPKPDPRGWKQDRSGGPQKGPKPFEGWH